MLTPAARTDTAQAAPSLAAAGHGENKTMEVLEDSPCTIPYNYLSTSDTLKLTAFDSPPEQT